MIYVSALAAIVGGAFLFKGENWARWLLVLWMAFHIVVGALHGIVPLLTHAVIFSVILFFLFRRPASDYFQPSEGRGTRPVRGVSLFLLVSTSSVGLFSAQ